MELRPYQQKAVDWLSQHPRGILVLAAGGGKTLCLAGAIARCMEEAPDHKPKIGWIANTKEQVDQAWAALRAFDIPNRAHVVAACAAAENNWADFDVLVVDECQHAPSPSWRRQIETCLGVRWGMSATPWTRDKSRNKVLLDMFGGNVYVIDRSEVDTNLCPARVVWLDACDKGLPERIEAEITAELTRRLRFRRYQQMPIQRARGEVAWGVCADIGIAYNDARNEAAIQAVFDHDEPTLVLCGLVEHAKYIADRVTGTAVWSGMPTKERAKAINGFRSGEIRRLVATSLADEGFDAPCAEVLILASGGRNEARTIQRTGRVLRNHPGKSEAIIYDFKDSTIPLMHRHAQRRADIYEKLGYANAEFDTNP